MFGVTFESEEKASFTFIKSHSRIEREYVRFN